MSGTVVATMGIKIAFDKTRHNMLYEINTTLHEEIFKN